MVQRHLHQRYDFLCLTDDATGLDPGIATAKLDSLLHGWWHKLTLFRPDPYGIKGRILFIDLDSVIVGNLDELADYAPDEPLTICRDFMAGIYNSSVFRLDSGALPFIWERFAENPAQVMQTLHGDQEFISIQTRAELFPPGWCVSYRLQAQDRVPPDARVICFHGEPKPHACGGWVKGKWRCGLL
jgi:hypothetical protein